MSLMLMLLFWIGWFCSNLSQQIPPTLFVAGPLCLAQLPLDVSFMTWVATLILLHMFNRCSGISSRIWPVISTSNIHHILRIAHWMVVVVSNLAADPRPYGFTIMAAMAMASPLPSISHRYPRQILPEVRLRTSTPDELHQLHWRWQQHTLQLPCYLVKFGPPVIMASRI